MRVGPLDALEGLGALAFGTLVDVARGFVLHGVHVPDMPARGTPAIAADLAFDGVTNVGLFTALRARRTRRKGHCRLVRGSWSLSRLRSARSGRFVHSGPWRTLCLSGAEHHGAFDASPDNDRPRADDGRSSRVRGRERQSQWTRFNERRFGRRVGQRIWWRIQRRGRL